jgi:putative ABC transport system ATP-binding protein
MTAIELRNVKKCYGNRRILENISLVIEKRQFVSLVGPSGSGKSTLLNMIGLLETFDKGEIFVFGQALPDINSRRATLMRRNIINYLFQSFALIHNLTVEQNLNIAMNFVDISKKEKQKKMQLILEQVELTPLIREKVNTLSGGEQQRVALARAMLKPGELILADEPTGSLDEKLAEKIFKLLKDLSIQYQKTIVMVTHDPKLAQQTNVQIDLAHFTKEELDKW